MSDVLQKLRIQSSLFYVKHNLPESSSLPELERVLADYLRDESLRREIAEMLSGDSLERLYAVILLWRVEQPAAEKVLEELAANDPTPMLLPRTGGMGWIEASVKGAALDFLAGESLMGENWQQAENLSNLSFTISKQAESEGRTFERDSLPKWADVLEARENPEKERALLSEAGKLNDGAASERIYAGVLLKGLGNPKYKEILKSLREDETSIIYRSDDMPDRVPAKAVAEFYLDPKPPAAPPKNIIAKTFDWLNETFTKGNKENK